MFFGGRIHFTEFRFPSLSLAPAARTPCLLVLEGCKGFLGSLAHVGGTVG